ncbi:hypothetical protein K435DRAFT_959492 [Dendrothele bispora CBS 962.96]|uniref:Cyclic-AMP phosphodiesterase n=1 Tax=Dendrothele bispora (strain CBS 962.96) TaxID=1314807 RepID=A0A4S8MXC9_DENBC|nr:hypothetical protein K435DRAFT_959492 [Dendrothele bispora CBS 962.96]
MSNPFLDLLVVGSGGGPDETNLSAYLIKPCNASWEAGILALEAGSGQGALNQLLLRNPDLFSTSNTTPPVRHSASEIYSFVRAFLLSHAHLDHLQSLVISAGSLSGPRKRLYALKGVLEDAETVFGNRLWPNLASWDETDEDYKYLYAPLYNNGKYQELESFPQVSVKVVPVNHGYYETSGQYDSSAFFIRDNNAGKEFLFFGDVEPDSLSASPRTIDVWRLAAPKIPDQLNAIFIECSWPSSREDDMLHGHLKPEHLRDELLVLAKQVYVSRNPSAVAGTSRTSGPRTRPNRKKQKLNPEPTATPTLEPEALHGILDGLRVYVMHCKEQLDGRPGQPMKDLIVGQVRALVDAEKLGVEVFSVDQGMHIKI